MSNLSGEDQLIVMTEGEKKRRAVKSFALTKFAAVDFTG